MNRRERLLLIEQAKSLYGHEPKPVDIDATVYALDSTTIDLCLSLFPWAPFRKTKAAIKLHTLLNIQGAFLSLFSFQTVNYMMSTFWTT
jgi:hypothetical protein